MLIVNGLVQIEAARLVCLEGVGLSAVYFCIMPIGAKVIEIQQ